MAQSLKDRAERTDRLGRAGGLLDAAASLQCKATVLVTVLVLTVMASVSGYLLHSSVKLAQRHQREQVVQLAGMLARAAGTTLAGGEYEALEALARKAANGAPLQYVVLSGTDGGCLAAVEHPGLGILERLAEWTASPMLGIPTYHAEREDMPALVDVTYPISQPATGDASVDGQPTRLLGYVRTGVVANRWYHALANRLDLLVGVSILVAVMAIPLGFVLIRRIVSPLDDLALVLGEFSEGNLDIRCSVRRRDEIGRLAVAFNRMADQHQRTHGRIVRLNEELEERVAARTKQLNELVSREPLTGLFNRRHLSDVLRRSCAEAMRYGSDLSCVMLDLDDFKNVNDVHGHHVGDEVLMRAARTISAQLRSSDIAARFGGDEFVVLLPQTDVQRARVLAERIAEQFSRDATPEGLTEPLTMSMGIASVATLETQGAEALSQAADLALYRAKAAGKRCIITAEPAPRSAPL